jgi:enoyl-CoA hydratase/carnithine racemase
MSSLIIEEDGPVLRATMNRPERLNAADSLLVEELRELFSSLHWRRDIRVVVLAARSARDWISNWTESPPVNAV